VEVLKKEGIKNEGDLRREEVGVVGVG